MRLLVLQWRWKFSSPPRMAHRCSGGRAACLNSHSNKRCCPPPSTTQRWGVVFLTHCSVGSSIVSDVASLYVVKGQAPNSWGARSGAFLAFLQSPLLHQKGNGGLLTWWSWQLLMQLPSTFYVSSLPQLQTLVCAPPRTRSVWILWRTMSWLTHVSHRAEAGLVLRVHPDQLFCFGSCDSFMDRLNRFLLFCFFRNPATNVSVLSAGWRR